MHASDDLNLAVDASEAEVGDDRFDGSDLCPACLAEVSVGCKFCPACAAPVAPLAAWTPFDRIFAEGYIYRQAVAAPRRLLVFMGAMLVFFPLFATGTVLFAWSAFVAKEYSLDLLEGAFITLVGALGMYHVTLNYLNRPACGTESPSEGGES